jgi:four helix bundle protein
MKYESSIKTFTDLNTWQEAHKLVLAVYKLTREFPDEEKFGLTNQIRRAVVSISSNIAEGFSRDSYLDKKHFYVMAHGSLTEVQNQLLIAKDVGYISLEDFKQTSNQSVVVHKLLSGLIKSTKSHNSLSMIHNSATERSIS